MKSSEIISLNHHFMIDSKYTVGKLYIRLGKLRPPP